MKKQNINIYNYDMTEFQMFINEEYVIEFLNTIEFNVFTVSKKGLPDFFVVLN